MRLIDADELLTAFPVDDEPTVTKSCIRMTIQNMPTIEPNLILPERMERGDCYEVGESIVVMNHDDYYDLLCRLTENEPKQGEWTGEGDGYADGGIVYDIWYCSNCDHCEEGEELALPNFCPNCGARMKGADDGMDAV